MDITNIDDFKPGIYEIYYSKGRMYEKLVIAKINNIIYVNDDDDMFPIKIKGEVLFIYSKDKYFGLPPISFKVDKIKLISLNEN
jgi:hypothetical protein